MVSSVDGSSGSIPTDAIRAADAAASDALTRPETFLKLLVAQLRNQNPLQPTDAIQFVSQLAQFSELEQLIGMRQELSAIRAALGGDGSGARAPEALPEGT